MHSLTQFFLGALFSVCLFFLFLVTSAEAVLYWTPGYFEREYDRYDVLDAVSMEMDDLLTVTDHMMAYLRGKQENLQIQTTVNGETREFFNERELAHMEDVKQLFLLALTVRKWCILLAVLSAILLFFFTLDPVKILARSLLWGTVLFFSLTGLLIFFISRDFSSSFTKFHELFFTNDLWLLDPETDLLINIVPEAFFMDTAARIALIFCFLLLFTLILSFLFHVKHAGPESELEPEQKTKSHSKKNSNHSHPRH
ncbi:MAG: TIGR01906 family membrane protein [bacterium]|nr:TIGR01906 family membrane protein [bacterium]